MDQEENKEEKMKDQILVLLLMKMSNGTLEMMMVLETLSRMMKYKWKVKKSIMVEMTKKKLILIT